MLQFCRATLSGCHPRAHIQAGEAMLKPCPASALFFMMMPKGILMRK
ncbi:MAG: hypothetical protein QY317_00540 [Candidatus Jettenia caeni]|nr:MAG: hypothetical protein QY317_00540 [Candidatus Jettenia caeni]